jgi:DNA mismatch endonuclease (patch repair protein)
MVSYPCAATRNIDVHRQSYVIMHTSLKPKQEVSDRMRAVRRAGTEAESRLAKALRGLNLVFTANAKAVGCKPDIVFKRLRLAVFVDGDFWHGRLLVERGVVALRRSFRPSARQFWVPKIKRNVCRDERQCRLLRRHGWSVLRLWESDVLKNPSQSAELVCKRLRRRPQSLKRP